MKHKEEYLKYYTCKGQRVFPCYPNNKNPLTDHGYKDASLDQNVVDDWWDRYPDANIGLVTGKQANLVVVDVDVKNNAGGMESLKELQALCGEEFDTKVVETPSGGLHYYFSYPDTEIEIKCMTNFMPGIDIRAEGGYVVAPGSSIDDKQYTFKDRYKRIDELPHTLLEALNEKKRKNTMISHSWDGGIQQSFEQGSRNHDIFNMACSLRGNGIPYEVAVNQILIKAEDCNPALSEVEAIRCLDSAYSRYMPNPKNPTDVGNAKRLVGLFGEDIRYVYEYKKWICWNGSRWLFDEAGHIHRLAKETAKSIYQEAANEGDEDRRRGLMNHALRSENKNQLDSMIEVAKTEDGITISQSRLDQDKYLLGVSNGAINLRTGNLLDNSKNSMLTKQAGISFDPNAECPLWLKFINEITNGDQELSNYLKNIVGYSLTGDTSEQVLFFLYGHGANGKSVFVNILQDLLGDYAMQTPVSTIMTREKGSINNDIARLCGVRFVATTETEEGSRFNESEVKLITGGDMVTARFLHKEFFQYRPQFALWVSGNHKPVPGDSYSIWRRLILIPFSVKFSEENQDKHLTSKLRSELPGILNWAVDGCLEWQEKGLTTPKIILDATKEYKSEMDRIRSWMLDCCIENPKPNSSARVSDIYQSYKSWAKNNGEWIMTQRILNSKLAERGYKKSRESSGVVFIGIELNNSHFEDF